MSTLQTSMTRGGKTAGTLPNSCLHGPSADVLRNHVLRVAGTKQAGLEVVDPDRMAVFERLNDNRLLM